MDIRFTFMFRVDAEELLTSLELRNYKKFFIEVNDTNYHDKNGISDFTFLCYTDGGTYYFETESGDYLPEWNLAKEMGKKSATPDVPKYTIRYLESGGDNDITFSPDETRQLQIFTSNYSELKKNPLKAPSLCSSGPFYNVFLGNTETELKAYVLVFRKIYSSDKQAGGSFPDLCEAIMVHENTALALLAEDSLAYFKELNEMDIRDVPKDISMSLGAPCIYELFKNYPSKKTVYDLVQLFFYTQFHHNPHSGRARELQQVQSFLKRHDADNMLKYMFFMTLFTFQQLFFNVGQSFVGTYQAYDPRLINPTKISNIGGQGATTEELQKRSKFEKFKRSFAHVLWIDAKRPACGEYAFEEEAERRMLLSLGRIRI